MGLLTRRGHHVTVVGNGRDAVERVARDAFDLALMDLQMPVMGGLEATALIRDLERNGGCRLRIVAMTAHAMSRDRDRCLAAGMDGYLSKPIGKDELYLAVEATDPAAVQAPVCPRCPGTDPAASQLRAPPRRPCARAHATLSAPIDAVRVARRPGGDRS